MSRAVTTRGPVGRVTCINRRNPVPWSQRCGGHAKRALVIPAQGLPLRRQGRESSGRADGANKQFDPFASHPLGSCLRRNDGIPRGSLRNTQFAQHRVNPPNRVLCDRRFEMLANRSAHIIGIPRRVHRTQPPGLFRQQFTIT